MIMKLYESYENELRMNIPFDAEAILAAHTPPPVQPPLQPQQPTQPVEPSQQAQPPQTVQIPQIPQQTVITPFRFKIKLAAIESHDESFVWVTDGLINPPAQGGAQLSIGGAQFAVPAASAVPTITFKLGRWHRHGELGGLTFE